MTGPLPWTVGETSQGRLNAKMVLRLPRLVSDLQHHPPRRRTCHFSPNSPILTFLQCFEAVPGIYYVLTLVFFEKIWSSVCLCSRDKSGQSAKLDGEVLTPRWS